MEKRNIIYTVGIIVLVIVIIVAGIVLGAKNQSNINDVNEKNELGNKSSEKSNGPISLGFEYYLNQPNPNLKIAKEEVKVKGIYVTGWTVGTKDKFSRLIELVNNTELNAMVIDIKEDKGRITYNSEIDWIKESGSIVNMVGNIHDVLAKLKENNIYPIARVVCFKDSNLCDIRPELAIKTKDGKIWRDRNGVAWLNPYNTESWEYILELSKEIIKIGFKEIQFDYVRFPTDGDVSNIDYGDIENTKSKAEAIADFLSYAKKELEPLGADVSADIFGIVPIVKGDLEGIGQSLELVSQDIDYICPMVYPSHYANIKQNGVGQRLNGILYEYPDLDPYGVVYNTLVPAKKRLETSDAEADVRPWLQAFTADYLHNGAWQYYGASQINEQIKATYDAGYSEWLLWDPNNNYSDIDL
jgi:hypothetical protein